MSRDRAFSVGCAVILPVMLALFLLGMCSRMVGAREDDPQQSLPLGEIIDEERVAA